MAAEPEGHWACPTRWARLKGQDNLSSFVQTRCLPLRGAGADCGRPQSVRPPPNDRNRCRSSAAAIVLRPLCGRETNRGQREVKRIDRKTLRPLHLLSDVGERCDQCDPTKSREQTCNAVVSRPSSRKNGYTFKFAAETDRCRDHREIHLSLDAKLAPRLLGPRPCATSAKWLADRQATTRRVQ